MNQTKAVMAALHVQIADRVEATAYGTALVPEHEAWSALSELDVTDHAAMHATLTALFLQMFRKKVPLPVPERRGFLCNVSNAVDVELVRYIRELDVKKNRVRPSLAIGYEASLPTAMSATRCDFLGPTTSVIDPLHGLQLLGFACNLIAEEQADLMVIAHIDRRYEEGVTDRFQGTVTVAAILAPTACFDVAPIGFVRDWGWNSNHEAPNGSTLLDFLQWLQETTEASRFVSAPQNANGLWITTGEEVTER